MGEGPAQGGARVPSAGPGPDRKDPTRLGTREGPPQPQGGCDRSTWAADWRDKM